MSATIEIPTDDQMDAAGETLRNADWDADGVTVIYMPIAESHELLERIGIKWNNSTERWERGTEWYWNAGEALAHALTALGS